METLILSLLTFMAPVYDIEPALAAAVVKTESQFNPKAVGQLKELGLFQIRPEYSKYSKTQLLDIEMNLKAGLEMLAKAKKSCYHNTGKLFVLCHNLGLYGAKKIKHPKLFPYYIKVNKNYLAYQGKI
jgi:soluble lytic murein transglycosylase